MLNYFLSPCLCEIEIVTLPTSCDWWRLKENIHLKGWEWCLAHRGTQRMLAVVVVIIIVTVVIITIIIALQVLMAYEPMASNIGRNTNKKVILYSGNRKRDSNSPLFYPTENMSKGAWCLLGGLPLPLISDWQARKANAEVTWLRKLHIHRGTSASVNIFDPLFQNIFILLIIDNGIKLKRTWGVEAYRPGIEHSLATMWLWLGKAVKYIQVLISSLLNEGMFFKVPNIL